MKLAVIADIHSNHAALRAALTLADSQQPDELLFLGDYVTDCPYPQKTMSLIYEYIEKYPCHFVRGNREDYILRHHKNTNDGWCYSSSAGSLLYTYENLTERDIEFFAAMPICLDVIYDGCPPLTACHGSPAKTRENIRYNYEVLSQYANEVRGDILLCGHTHRYSVLDVNNKTFIFCPSAGLPVPVSPDTTASTGMITILECNSGRWKHTTLPFTYDIEALIAEFAESGLIEAGKVWSAAIIKTLRERRIYSSLQLTFEKCYQLAYGKGRTDGYTGKGLLPEKYWEAAAAELEII